MWHMARPPFRVQQLSVPRDELSMHMARSCYPWAGAIARPEKQIARNMVGLNCGDPLTALSDRSSDASVFDYRLYGLGFLSSGMLFGELAVQWLRHECLRILVVIDGK